MYSAVSHLLAEQKALINMYSAFRDYQQQDEGTAERHKMRESLLDEKKSLFSSHPTYRERIDAMQHLPRASRTEDQPAIELFDDPESLERELTEFVTGFIALSHQQVAAAAAAAG
jgi:hypothetical protein